MLHILSLLPGRAPDKTQNRDALVLPEHQSSGAAAAMLRRVPRHVTALTLAVLLTTGCRSSDEKKEPVSQLHPAPSHLVAMLHGVGADAKSFQRLADALSPSLPNAEFLVPDGLQPYDGASQGRQWFSVQNITIENRPLRVREGASAVSRYLDAELARRGLGGDKLVVVGFSQGAIVAAWLALHRTPRPAAIVMLSGRVAEADAPTWGAGPPVFMGHGELDKVMPLAVMEPGAQVLQAWGAQVTTRVYRGLAHHVDEQELADVGQFLQNVLR
jgi:phospholipase/carboxylesterase